MKRFLEFTQEMVTNAGSAQLIGFLLTGLTVSLVGSAFAQFTPVNVAHLNIGGLALDVAVSGNHAFVANHSDGLRIYDISNPMNPINVGHANDGSCAFAVAVSDNLACIANFTDGLRVYDISNPTNPISVGHANNGGTAVGVAVSGHYAYLANFDDGLRIYDISNRTNIVHVAHTNDGGYAHNVAISGNHAYLANSYSLNIYDISEPAYPACIGRTNTDLAWDVAVSGNYAYLADYDRGLYTYDISNPAVPVNVCSNGTRSQPHGVTISGNYLFLGNGSGGLSVYDVSNPRCPVSAGRTTSNYGGYVYRPAISGNYVFVPNEIDGLRVYLLVPQIAIRLNSINTILLSWSVPPAPNFVLQQSSGLTVSNWSDMTNAPVIINNRCQVELPLSAGSAFYRLKFN